MVDGERIELSTHGFSVYVNQFLTILKNFEKTIMEIRVGVKPTKHRFADGYINRSVTEP